ncbi:hypothetical protein [Verrucosispora sioxanthis]|uniref:Uncharacterized protein n=1 Tax=Verrucosispora sioxanthis TaxID=2499994 RepID=A0A6M1L2Y1_9ACTN|nr:hypothetical protein [Verrucosispora sioxanthis]NEE63941.1 hypothetical protein [Verrucosispora sioxanthis]NGM13051.1 hypothetical protein [Verrucosispora sioxanthis]
MSYSTTDSVALSRVRCKFAVFSGLSLVAAAVGLPAWSVAALVLTSLAIPVAVGLAGGGGLLRQLLRPGANPGGGTRSPDRGTRRTRPST